MVYQMICKHCGLPEDQHHDFERKMPKGCCCDPYEWATDRPVSSICSKYVGNGKGPCKNCEHSPGCHE
jgi:hypothetical protein